MSNEILSLRTMYLIYNIELCGYPADFFFAEVYYVNIYF